MRVAVCAGWIGTAVLMFGLGAAVLAGSAWAETEGGTDVTSSEATPPTRSVGDGDGSPETDPRESRASRNDGDEQGVDAAAGAGIDDTDSYVTKPTSDDLSETAAEAGETLVTIDTPSTTTPEDVQGTSPSADYREPSADYREPSADYREPSADYRERVPEQSAIAHPVATSDFGPDRSTSRDVGVVAGDP
ncbi:hypothetical protein JDV09_17975, partial [Mycobacterium sp. Y57]